MREPTSDFYRQTVETVENAPLYLAGGPHRSDFHQVTTDHGFPVIEVVGSYWPRTVSLCAVARKSARFIRETPRCSSAADLPRVKTPSRVRTPSYQA
jgi:hypothetical protein